VEAVGDSDRRLGGRAEAIGDGDCRLSGCLGGRAILGDEADFLGEEASIVVCSTLLPLTAAFCDENDLPQRRTADTLRLFDCLACMVFYFYVLLYKAY
jgi:hypothetical protein